MVDKTKEKSNIFKDIVKYFVLNYIGFIIFWPIFDLILAAFNHTEFHYSVVSHIVTPIFWAILFTIFELAFRKKDDGKK